MARCFVTRQLPGPALERLAATHQVEVWPEKTPPSPEELAEHVHNVQGLLSLLSDQIDTELLAHAPNLKAISNYAVGYDNIDLQATGARGIPVGHTPNVLTDATADLTFALMLAAARKLPDGIEEVRTGTAVTWQPDHNLGIDVHGATLGIIGFGRIGRAVARRAEGFSMEILTMTSASHPSTFEVLLQSSDFVSIHCPLTPATRHLIGATALEQMKPTAILINTSRGPIVDQQALAEALHSGSIAGAALDVTEPEPLPPDDPLLKAPNLIVVPHIGSATRATRERMANVAVDNLLAALAGQRMPHQVPAVS